MPRERKNKPNKYNLPESSGLRRKETNKKAINFAEKFGFAEKTEHKKRPAELLPHEAFLIKAMNVMSS